MPWGKTNPLLCLVIILIADHQLWRAHQAHVSRETCFFYIWRLQVNCDRLVGLWPSTMAEKLLPPASCYQQIGVHRWLHIYNSKEEHHYNRPTQMHLPSSSHPIRLAGSYAAAAIRQQGSQLVMSGRHPRASVLSRLVPHQSVEEPITTCRRGQGERPRRQ